MQSIDLMETYAYGRSKDQVGEKKVTTQILIKFIYMLKIHMKQNINS